jgi:diacylglycerol kinase (ATP)
MKRHLILNPNSGRGNASQIVALEEFFAPKSKKYTSSICYHVSDAIRSTRQALHAGAEQIICVGGDGTINAAVSGFFENKKAINPNACLALSAAGTGSDYIRTVFNNNFSLMENWQQVALNPECKPVDLGITEVYGRTFHFVNMASAGLSAVIVQMKARSPRVVPRQLSYAAATLLAMTQKKHWPVTIKADEKNLEIPSVMDLFICKGKYMGGGMKTDCKVSLSDGLFDLTIVKSMGPVRALRVFPKLYSGDFSDIAEVEKHRVKTVEINSDSPLPVECDGDWIGNCNLRFSVIPQAIKVCFPKKT